MPRQELAFLMLSAMLVASAHGATPTPEDVRSKALRMEPGWQVRLETPAGKIKGRLVAIEDDGLMVQTMAPGNGLTTAKYRYEEIRALKRSGSAGAVKNFFAVIGIASVVLYLVVVAFVAG